MLNPVPHAALLQFTGLSVLSASPERFLRLDPRSVHQPDQGHPARGPDARAGCRAADGAARSEKDRAENLMIVDLMRNDSARVCESARSTCPKLFGGGVLRVGASAGLDRDGSPAPRAHASTAVRACFPPGR